MKSQLNTTAPKQLLISLARSSVLAIVALISSNAALAQSSAQPAPTPEKITKPTAAQKLKKIPAKLAKLGHFKKAKKDRIVDSRMNSADAPGTVGTAISNVKLKKIPLSKEKAEDVAVAQ